MGSQSEIHLICFDLGRVLLRICENWLHACEVAGVPAPTKQLSDADRAAIHAINSEHEVGKIEFDEICRRMGEVFEVDPRHVGAMSDVFLLTPYPGVRELIDEVNAVGYQTACLSNTNASHWRIMYDSTSPARLPLERLTYQFASHLAGHRKPDEGIFEHVERATGWSGPQIVFFDDVAENVATARKRGWRAEVIAHDGEPLRQVRRHLARLGVLKSA